MKYLKQYNIPIAGHESGSRQYELNIDGLFFEQYPESEINECAIVLQLDVIREEGLFVLVFHLKGQVGLVCDRCLDPFQFPIDCQETLSLKIDVKGKKDEDDVISADAQEIDIRQHVYDFIMLQIPFRRTHPDDEAGESQCDQEVLRKIEELSTKKDKDSPWDKLKDLQNN